MRLIPSFMSANVTIGCNLMLLLLNYPLWSQVCSRISSSCCCFSSPHGKCKDKQICVFLVENGLMNQKGRELLLS